MIERRSNETRGSQGWLLIVLAAVVALIIAFLAWQPVPTDTSRNSTSTTTTSQSTTP
jgi:hypothetical protein